MCDPGACCCLSLLITKVHSEPSLLGQLEEEMPCVSAYLNHPKVLNPTALQSTHCSKATFLLSSAGVS